MPSRLSPPVTIGVKDVAVSPVANPKAAPPATTGKNTTKLIFDLD